MIVSEVWPRAGRHTDGLRIYDVTTGAEDGRFAGPTYGRYAFDRVLITQTGDHTVVWDVERGEKLLEDTFGDA